MAVMIVLAQYIRVVAGRRSVAGTVTTPTDCTDGEKIPSEHEAQAYQIEGRSPSSIPSIDYGTRLQAMLRYGQTSSDGQTRYCCYDVHGMAVAHLSFRLPPQILG